MRLFTGDRSANLLKGASLIILVYIVYTTYDLATPIDRGFTSIYSKNFTKPGGSGGRYSSNSQKLHIYADNRISFEVDVDTYLQMQSGDSVQIWSSEHYQIVQKYKYYNRELGIWITNNNHANIIQFFPWLQVIFMGLNLAVLWPRFTEFTTVLKPFFFAAVSFIVYRFILL